MVDRPTLDSGTVDQYGDGMPRSVEPETKNPPRFVAKTREDFALAIVQAIHPLSTAFKRLRPAVLGRPPLGPAMYAVLDVLHRASDWNVPILARGLMLDRQSVQRVVNQLVAKGLLMRVKSATKVRSPIIKITALGVTMLEEIRAAQWAELERLVAPLPLEELAACDSVLQHLRVALVFSPEHTYTERTITRKAFARGDQPARRAARST
jgi:DNA-binding MarR family transcriptional regulator